MSPFLPPEILDLIVDHLSEYERTTLRVCCLVSQSWVPRARRRLFFRIEFSSQSSIQLWIKAFPDPSTSLAHYTRVLTLDGFVTIETLGTRAYPWAHAFHHLVELRLINRNGQGVISLPPPRALVLTPFHGLFPTLKSLSLYRSFIPPSELPSLICSFPLLKDLRLSPFPTRHTAAISERNTPSTSPELTGALHLSNEVGSVLPMLLGLPNHCFRFSKILMRCRRVHDSDLTGDLVLKCSDALEFLSVVYYTFERVYRAPSPFDLSKAIKLKELKFGLPADALSVQWITTTLQTVNSPKLEQIIINSRMTVDRRPHGEWRDLDRLLARLWTSHSIRPEIKFLQAGLLERVAPSLLPELATAGAFDSVVS